MRLYSVDEVFEILRENKITTHKESVRRWLREGVIKGIAPATRKEGWLIAETALNEFLKNRLPETFTTKVVNKPKIVVNDEGKAQIRSEMWFELTKKGIYEGSIELKKTFVRECIQHRHYSAELEKEVWQRCVENSKAYKKPRVSYLLEAFLFEGKRILLDKNFESIEEQIIFAIIEHVRKS